MYLDTVKRYSLQICNFDKMWVSVDPQYRILFSADLLHFVRVLNYENVLAYS